MKNTISLVLVLAMGLAAEVANADFTFGEPTNLGVDVHAPTGLQAVVEGESVFLSWSAPQTSEGLIGYIVYRDGEVINAYFVVDATYVDDNPGAGIHNYTIASFYNDGNVYFAPDILEVFLCAGGTGEPGDPFRIATAKQLTAIGSHPSLLDRHYVLISDIDLDPNLPGRQIFDRAVIAPDTSDMDEGFQGSAFTGTFDGNRHTVSNLTIEGNSYLGLFGALWPEAQVINVNVVNVDVTGNGWNIGAIAGTSGGTVQDCYSSGLVMGYSDVGGLVGSNNSAYIINSSSNTDVVGIEHVGGLVGSQLVNDSDEGAVYSSNATGSVFGWQWVGGLIGFNQGTVSKCSSDSFINGSSFVGGLVGANFNDVIHCNSAGFVSGNQYVGGLIGGHHQGLVNGCDSVAKVSGGGYVGGLVGISMANLTQCYSVGLVSGTTFVGGLIGDNDAGSITNCYSRSTVQGDNGIGGLVGANAGSISFTYSAGTVSGESDVGGLVGKTVTYGDVQGSVTASFWDVEASGQSSSNGGIGLTTAELQDVNTYVDAGWDFAGESDNGTENFWYITMDSYARFFSFQGIGTPEDPYQIQTVWHLVSIGSDPNMLDKHFKLTTHIDLDPNQLGSRVFTEAVIAPEDVNMSIYDWGHYQSVPFRGNVPFSGTLDGGGFELRNMRVEGLNYLGLFGMIGEGAYVSNLSVVNAHVNGLEGVAYGILAGANRGRVIHCHTAGLVRTDGSDAGGLIGHNYHGQVNHCSSDADVHGKNAVGGLVGWNQSHSEIVDCYSTGAVSGIFSHAGGFIGLNVSPVRRCYSTGTVTGGHDVGGFLGSNWYVGASVEDCYSTGSTTGEYVVGGFVGSCGPTPRQEGGTISRCYSIGAVTADGQAGGFAGQNKWSITHSFWNVETSGQDSSDGGFGLTTAQMQDVDTYLNAGWDFFAQDMNGHEDIWIMNLYPVHYPVRIPGQGTQANPYLISNNNAFVVLRNTREFSSEHYLLTEDIDLATIQFSGPVFPRFSGTFDGGGHTMRNLTIIGGDNLGLFGSMEPGASVKNLAITDANVIGTGGNIGVIAGVNNGRVINCSSTGSVQGGNLKHFGGLVGRNYHDGEVINCFSSCSVASDGTGAVGGLIGANHGRVTDCYSMGSISGRQNVGGLVGFNNGGEVINCYSTGVVIKRFRHGGLVGLNGGRISNCFWDTQTSGLLTSDGGTGLTTAEMQTASTFLNAGWDFIDETINGTDDIWWILEGQDYPRLWWEAAEQ